MTAQELLRQFRSVEKVFTADEKRLKKTKGIGKKRARDLREILSRRYDK